MMAVAILWFECDSSLLKNWAIATAAIMLRVEESGTYWYRYSFQASSSAKVSTAASGGTVASALRGSWRGGVRAWHITSGGRRLPRGRTPLDHANVVFALSSTFLD